MKEVKTPVKTTSYVVWYLELVSVNTGVRHERHPHQGVGAFTYLFLASQHLPQLPPRCVGPSGDSQESNSFQAPL